MYFDFFFLLERFSFRYRLFPLICVMRTRSNHMIFLSCFFFGGVGMRGRILGYKFWKYRNVLSILATSFGIALPAWIVDQKNSILVSLFISHYNMFDIKRAITMKILVCYF